MPVSCTSKYAGLTIGYPRILAGTTTAAATTQALSADPLAIGEVIIQNDPDSANSVFVGNAGMWSIELEPGCSITIPVDSLGKVYINYPAAATVNWLAVAF